MLSGSLDAFRLSDVFQLLTLTEKTGVLHISTGPADGRVEFLRGEIAYAVSDSRHMPLAGRLLRGGLVTDSQLRTVVAAQRGGAPALSRVLLEEGVLDEKAFDQLLREQIQDAVFELMRLDNGTFTFDVRGEDEAETDPVRFTVPTDKVVGEGTRRLHEWPKIQEHVVSPGAIVTLAPQMPSDTGTISMDADQWQLLTLVDGRRTVRDLVDLTGLGEYATCLGIAGLVASGLIEVEDPSSGGRTGIAELVARHDLLRRLEERELGAPGAPLVEYTGGQDDTVHADRQARGSRPLALAATSDDAGARDGLDAAARPAHEAGVARPAQEATVVEDLPTVVESAQPTVRYGDDVDDEDDLAQPRSELEVVDGEDDDYEYYEDGEDADGLPQGERLDDRAPARRDDLDPAEVAVARELAALGISGEVSTVHFRNRPKPQGQGQPAAHPDDDRENGWSRPNRQEEASRGLLGRLIDVRKNT